MKDGPEKTIWGKDQKAWLFRTMKESNATWKVIISPTPLVGPDRLNKKDNHSNAGFQHEGDEVRRWLKENVPGNGFVVCGDRHWQYHSVHPLTGLHEFSVGAASDVHAGGTPGENKEYHRFHRVKGGFLSVVARGKNLSFRHHDVTGKVVYEYDPAGERERQEIVARIRSVRENGTRIKECRRLAERVAAVHSRSESPTLCASSFGKRHTPCAYYFRERRRPMPPLRVMDLGSHRSAAVDGRSRLPESAAHRRSAVPCYWFRALAGACFGEQPLLRAAETAVYGDTKRASSVVVRLTGTARTSTTLTPGPSPCRDWPTCFGP